MQTNKHRTHTARVAAMFPVKQLPDTTIRINLLDFDPELRRRFIYLTRIRQGTVSDTSSMPSGTRMRRSSSSAA